MQIPPSQRSRERSIPGILFGKSLMGEGVRSQVLGICLPWSLHKWSRLTLSFQQEWYGTESTDTLNACFGHRRGFYPSPETHGERVAKFALSISVIKGHYLWTPRGNDEYGCADVLWYLFFVLFATQERRIIICLTFFDTHFEGIAEEKTNDGIKLTNDGIAND